MNPLRGQNNVQGACDMGSFPHEVSGYRHISDADVRAAFEAKMARRNSTPNPVCAFPTCLLRRCRGELRGLFIQGEDLAQSDPNTLHVADALRSLDCLVVQDLFLNETSKFAHVFLPGDVVPRKGRHVHERGTAHQSRAAR